MNRQECKIGMKVCLIQDTGFGRQKKKREGEVIGMYSNYAVVRLLNKYNSAFFYWELTEVKEKDDANEK